MKVHASGDEWYPVYCLYLDPDSSRIEIEISEKTLKRWVTAFEAFEKAQQEIRKLVGQDPNWRFRTDKAL